MSLSKEAMYDTYNQHVKPVFGVDLKEEQTDAITSICCGKHVLVVLPTGFGKSLIFTSLPLIMDKVVPGNAPHMVLVIAPILALISDQQAQLEARGISVGVIGQRDKMSAEDVTAIKAGKRSVILASPESLRTAEWEEVLRSAVFSRSLVCVVFDEAHCISEWGCDFRPAYLEVCKCHTVAAIPVCLLTATCTRRVEENILKELDLSTDVVQIALLPDRSVIGVDGWESRVKVSKDLLYIHG